MKSWLLWEAHSCAFSLQKYWNNRCGRIFLAPPDSASLFLGDDSFPVSERELGRLGVEVKRIQNPGKYVDASGAVSIPPNTELGVFCSQRKFLQQDCISLSSATTPDYEAKKAMFYEEHMHEDAEVRLIIQGVGFFDVRDLSDCWTRIRVETGDLLVLPAGIYHRFCIDEQAGTLQAVRIFSSNPKWVPIARPCDSNAARIAYKQRVQLLRSLNQ